MKGLIQFGQNKAIGTADIVTSLDIFADQIGIRLIPTNAVGNDISKCAKLRNGKNGDMYDIATATQPQEYDLPLEPSVFANYDNEIWQKSSYKKSQFEIVTLTIMGQFTADLQSGSDSLLATLPAGFRPKRYMRRIESTFHEARVQIDVTNGGSIYVRGSAKTNDWLCCELSFSAVS